MSGSSLVKLPNLPVTAWLEAGWKAASLRCHSWDACRRQAWPTGSGYLYRLISVLSAMEAAVVPLTSRVTVRVLVEISVT